MSRGMSRGGSGFPIIIAVLGVLIIGVIGIFIYMQFSKGNDSDQTALASTVPTSEVTAIPTLTPEVTETPEPVVTVPPVTEEPTAEIAATATPYITAAPVTTSKTVWINVDALNMHPIADWNSETIGKIPYGTAVSGEISGYYMYTSYDGVSGYIYLKKSASSGRDCVVYSESALVPLDPDPDAPTEDLVSSHSFNESGSTLTLTITFTTGVYSDDNATGDLTSSDFSFSSNTWFSSISHVAGSQTAILTLNIDTGSPDPHIVSIKSQAIFNSAGTACTTQSFTQP